MSRNAEIIRELRAKAVAGGKCQVCRCRDQKPGRKTCQVCLDRGKATKKRLRADGRCGCGAPPARGIKLCRRCADAQNRNSLKRQERALAAGKCRHCMHRDIVSGLKHCRHCIDRASGYSKAARDRNRAAGLCACGSTRTRGYQTCADCREYWYAYSQLKEAA